MDPWTSFLVGIITSLLVSTAIVFAFAKPLNALLQEMCETELQGHFWRTFTNTMLYLTPLLATVLFGAIGEDRLVSTTVLIRNLLACSLGGIFVTVLTMGLIIIKNSPPRPISVSQRKSYSEEFWEDTKSSE